MQDHNCEPISGTKDLMATSLALAIWESARFQSRKSLEDFIRTFQQGKWERDPKRPRGPKINNEIDFLRLIDW